MKAKPWAAWVFAALLLAAAAHAAEVPLVKALEPCRPDVEKFCRGVEPGAGRILGCLKDHREEVSDVCKARLAQYRVKRKPAMTAGRAPGKPA